jgi:hypothetical protein
MPDGISFVTEESSTYSNQKTLQAGKVHSRLACIDDDENKEKIQEEEPLISLPIRTNSTRTGFLDSVRDEIPKDDVFSKIFEKIKDQMRKSEDFDEGKSSTYQSYRLDPNSNLLYLIERTGPDRLCVPKKLRKEILSYAHDNNAHGGVHRTYDFLRRSVFFPGMRKLVTEYVTSCPSRQVSKGSNQRPYERRMTRLSKISFPTKRNRW